VVSESRPRFLLIGSRGQVGWELARSLRALGDVAVADRPRLNLADPRTIGPVVAAASPTCIVNAAAFTDVDGAEAEPDVAFRVNAESPGVLAEHAAAIDALLVHYSTDYVFDGGSSVPYTELDVTAPLSVYGRSKLEGERAVLASRAQALILRTSWVFGTRRRNFLNTILRLARERETLRVVDDQVGTPTWCRCVAEGTARILERSLDGRDFAPPPSGRAVLHLTGAGHTTRFGFARYILQRAEREGHPLPELVPIGTAEYPTPALRPRYSVLDNSRLRETFGITLPDWRTQVDQCMDAR
jgi:dTDP-4-dehydrorhamnose reductase